MKKAYSAENILDANLVGGLFQAAGIECQIRGESLVGIQGEIPLNSDSAPSVWVLNEKDFQQARQIVINFEANSETAAAGSNWHCDNCGEENESQFSQCWQCQSLKESD